MVIVAEISHHAAEPDWVSSWQRQGNELTRVAIMPVQISLR